ncbi:MAG: hypothetical protein EXX96DRAFT_589969 [Benjaminiella poitrasii]|nr:MAG: hypothetical protein EXX96DRAFT_589969 [Benjaminiella poitrasii]
MKAQLIFIVLLCLICSFVASSSIRYDHLDDFEIAKLFIEQNSLKTANNDQGEIEYPLPNTTWHVGDLVNVTFKTNNPQQTVSIFFFQTSEIVAGGPLDKTTFPFVVPSDAVSSANGTTLLIAVRRMNRYLQTVDSVVVEVLPAKA